VNQTKLASAFANYTYLEAQQNLRYLLSVLSIVPPKKKPELYDQALAVSENQIELLRSGIIDKTVMYEAVDDFGMKYAIWVKYPPSLFHYNYSK